MGIDLEGRLHKGCTQHSSLHTLAQELFSQDIALLHGYQKKTASFYNPIKTSLKVQFFRHLATLVDAGVYVDQALIIVHDNISHKDFKHVVKDCIDDVAQGIPLHEGLQKYSDVFDGITIQLVQAGQFGSNLAKALTLLANYQENKALFKKQLRSAAFLPLMTLLFFLVICAVIFVVIVPLFTTMFSSLGKDLPASTQRLQTISSFLTGWQIIAALGVFIGVVLIIKKFLQRPALKQKYDFCMVKIPFIGSLLFESKLTYFFESAALLLQGGVPVVQAFEYAQEMVDNNYMQSKIHTVIKHVDAGKSLSTVMHDMPYFFLQESRALVALGEESGNLDSMLIKVAEVYRERVKRKLHIITTVLQPCLMIVLGLLITALIVTVYIPIFDLSYAIH